MAEFFLEIVNRSISASWLVLAVLSFRLLFRKAPKWVNVLLWGIVAVRLLCPFSVFCIQAAIYMMKLPFEISDFDMRAYLFMIVFVMLCSALSFLTALPQFAEKGRKESKSKKGADEA